MATANSGAVFFLGTRAHYQVLQPPESRYDDANGNASTETIYRNPSVQGWEKTEDSTSCGGERSWGYCDNDTATEEKDKDTGVKRRAKRRSSETALCERDAEMKPALLNNPGDRTPSKPKASRRTLLSFLTSLARRKRRLHADPVQYLQHIESALTACTYRESCRCLECQSRYFDCDESEDYSSDESDYTPRYVTKAPEPPPEESEDEDDEVFVDTVPGDNTSTDLLIEGREKMSVSSDEVTEDMEPEDMDIEVAAGTPVLLNYLLTHPITCSIQ